MSSNPRDENRVPTIAGVSPLSSTTPIIPYVDPTTHELYVKSTTGIEISGTVTADLGATDNALLDALVLKGTNLLNAQWVAISDGVSITVVNSLGADDLLNTTNQLIVGSFGYWYDGDTWDRARGDSTNGLLVNLGSNNDVGHNITGIGHGVKTVTTAGTDLALATTTPCKRVVIQAQTDNTTGVAVGATGVDATVATGTGIFLYPGDSIELDCDDLADIYVDALTNGEGVRFVYYT